MFLRHVSGITLTLTTMNTPLPYASRHLGNPWFRNVVTIGLLRSPVRILGSVLCRVQQGDNLLRRILPSPQSPCSRSFIQCSPGGHLTLWILGFRQSSFDHISQRLQSFLRISGFSHFVLHRCYVHISLSVRANCVALVNILLSPYSL